jgi:hypothetical protein
VLCTKCCQFLWIVHSSLPLSFVCLRPVSCVPNVAGFSGLSIHHCPSLLFVFVQCLVYQMLPVSLDCPLMIAPQFCLSSSCVLCTKCCQFFWIVHSGLPLSFVYLRPVSCVPNVASFSGLSIHDCPSVVFVFVLCLVYQMLPVSLDCPFFIAPQFCLSSSSVLCTKCCQFLWIVHYCFKHRMKTNNTEGQWRMDNPEKLATFDTQDTGRRQTKLRGNH